MIYMVVFWVIYALILTYYSHSRWKKVNPDTNLIILGVIVAFSFLIIGVISNDPLFSAIGVPKEYEWLAGLILSGFTAWQFYFDPLKKKIISLENNFSEYFGVSKTKFEHIEKGIDEIKMELKRVS